jgi:RND family efflux transporter MFP subunit
MLWSKSFRIESGLGLMLLVVGCGEPAESPSVAQPGDTVVAPTAVAVEESVPLRVEATGSVEPWTRASPGTKIMARIETVPVREGDRVRRGELLARLEQADLRAAVHQADAARGMAEAELENATAQHRRMRELHSRGSATEKNLEDAEYRFRAATAGLQQAEANLEAARVMLGYAEIVSPIDGWIVAKHAEVGDMTAPGMPLFVVEDLSRVKVRLTVPETDVVALEVGDSGRVTIDVFRQEQTAEIIRIIPAGDPASRTFEVQMLLSNPEGRLKSGMFARALFEHGERTVLRVPASAVVERGQLNGLFVVDDQGRARLRWTRLGRNEDGRVEVLSGLTSGERYVVAPPPGLRDGRRVESSR